MTPAAIDLIDRLPSGGIDVIDYETGKVPNEADVDRSLPLSVYALACREALGMRTLGRVTLSFTESALRLSTTRTDAQLEGARDDIPSRLALMRSGEFAARSGDACRWCDYRAMCLERD